MWSEYLFNDTVLSLLLQGLDLAFDHRIEVPSCRQSATQNRQKSAASSAS